MSNLLSYFKTSIVKTWDNGVSSKVVFAKEDLREISKTLFVFFVIFISTVLIIRFVAAKSVFFRFLLSEDTLLNLSITTIIFSVGVLILSSVSFFFARKYVPDNFLRAVGVIVASIIIFTLPFYFLSIFSISEECTDMCGIGAVLLWAMLFVASVTSFLLSVLYAFITRLSLLKKKWFVAVLFVIFFVLISLNVNLFDSCKLGDGECFVKKAIETKDYSICSRALLPDNCFYSLLDKTEDIEICDKGYIYGTSCYSTYGMKVGRPDLCQTDACKEIAFDELAIREGNLAYCDEAEKKRQRFDSNNGGTYHKYKCYGEVAAVKDDPLICKNLSFEVLWGDYSPRDTCLNSFATAKGDDKYCEEISLINRKSCREEVEFRVLNNND